MGCGRDKVWWGWGVVGVGCGKSGVKEVGCVRNGVW